MKISKKKIITMFLVFIINFVIVENVLLLAKDEVEVVFFYRPTCRECILAENFLLELNKKYPELKIKKYNLAKTNNIDLLSKYYNAYKIPFKYWNGTFAIFTTNKCFTNIPQIKAELEKEIITKSRSGTHKVEIPQVKQGLEQIFETFNILTIASVGIVDGLNPCAFTAIIFLVSYLSLIDRKGKDMLLVGWTFTLAVFVTYLLIGLGLFEFIKRLAFFSFLSPIISLSIAGVAILLGILSLYDYYKIKKGEIKDIVLQLPQRLKERIHLSIREESRVKHFILASLLLGFLVALLEFPCTGQVYLPIIFVLRHISELRARALLSLILYNFMFILPLIAVFIFAYKGTSSQAFTKLMQENAGKVKILTAILFFAMAAILITSTY